MAELKEIINAIENIAPLETQEEWDNSGLQINLGKNIKKIMLCVSVTEDVIKQTVENNCDMIVAHHPLYFKDNYDTQIVKELIRKHIPVYSIHTPFDKAKNGTTDMMIKSCGLCADETLNEYTKIYYADMPMKELIHKIKKGLSVDKIRVTNYNPKKTVKKVAFCAGSGTSFCEEVIKSGCDCFVTADLKYHCAIENNVVIIDVGHLESEKPALETLKNILNNFAECQIAKELPPISII